MQPTTANLNFVHRFVAAQGQGSGATLLLLHGTGGNETDLLHVGRVLSAEAALLSPRGKVLENGMSRFFRRLAEGVFDSEDLKRRSHELADFVAAAADVYGFDEQRVIAVGISNGANIAASMLLLRPRSLAAAVLFRPMVPLVPENLPDLSATRVLIRAGQQDRLVPQQQSERLAYLLESAGALVDLQWHPGGHMLDMKDIQAARSWLQAHGQI